MSTLIFKLFNFFTRYTVVRGHLEIPQMELGSITTGTLTLVGAALVYFLTKLWRARSIFVGFRKQGLVGDYLIQQFINL